MRGTLAVLITLTATLCRAAAPTTEPVDAPIRALVARLGDDDYRVRIASERQLKNLGILALPALRDAAGNVDPEIQQRARAVAMAISAPSQASIARPADPDVPQMQQMMGGGHVIILNGGRLVMNNGNVVVTISAGANGINVRDIDVTENGRAVHVHDGVDGVLLTVTEKDGQFKQYNAANGDDLKQKSPDAYKLYEKYTNGLDAGRR